MVENIIPMETFPIHSLEYQFEDRTLCMTEIVVLYFGKLYYFHVAMDHTTANCIRFNVEEILPYCSFLPWYIIFLQHTCVQSRPETRLRSWPINCNRFSSTRSPGRKWLRQEYVAIKIIPYVYVLFNILTTQMYPSDMIKYLFIMAIPFFSIMYHEAIELISHKS